MYQRGSAFHGRFQSGPIAPTLRVLPWQFNYRFTTEAKRHLSLVLFNSLVGHNEEYLRLFFPHGPPGGKQPWKLSDVQGANEGVEYSEAARGKRCGHIFQAREATYYCKTCTTDDTCVLCAKCFEASDHEGHQIKVSLSAGASGCCDCGDPEAWIRPQYCGIHTAKDDGGEELPATEAQQREQREQRGKRPLRALPVELQTSIRGTIAAALDYICDVFSCAPEHMRTPRHEQSILRDEELARLVGDWYNDRQNSEPCREYALIVWNDEKHTIDEVEEQVARACRKPKSYGREAANEVHAHGRSIVDISRDLSDLLRKARILEQIKVTVTIRSTRDVFREEMCATIVDWLADISGCSVGGDHDILMDAVCSEMLKPWRIGSNASNLSIAKQGLSDNQRSDGRLKGLYTMRLQRRVLAARQAAQQARVDIQLVVGDPARLAGVQIRRNDSDDDNNDDDDDDDDNDRIDDEMDLDEVLAQDPSITLGAGRPARSVDAMSIQAASSPQGRSDEDATELSPQHDPSELLARTNPPPPPNTPFMSPPKHWLVAERNTPLRKSRERLPIEEDLEKHVRIDFMILYDLRMWKTLRDNLRYLYISTVIKVPRFKRLLGLRFAAVYQVLAQLFLVADREPDHSIINLSLQMLTTPSIAEEIIERWDFFPKLLAILYTFLTKRQVGAPQDIDPSASTAFENGVMTNRRIHHFFKDMEYLLESKFVQKKIREEDQYLLQLLDFIKLHQGIYPNVRAIGEHIEYESDAWMATGNIIRDVIRMSRLFCGAFRWTKLQDPTSICRAIRQTAKTAITNSSGAEHRRFHEQELNASISFKTLETFQFERQTANYQPASHTIVNLTVENSPMSFHHILHYTLSWLIECGKSMSVEQLRGLLTFSQAQLQVKDPVAIKAIEVPPWDSEQYLLALFDVPLRVCAWLAQIKAGMWVRNGHSLRLQMSMYRGVQQRDDQSQRDIFMLQVALVVCSPETVLTSIIDRYGMNDWMRGRFDIKQGWEAPQMNDVAEDFIHLLIVLVSDRVLLRPSEEDHNLDESIAKREIVHALCFKPMSHSDLVERLPLKVANMNSFDRVLHQVASYRPPEGLQDSGSFEIKDQYYDELDPYNAFYSKNQREESENAWRKYKSKASGLPFDQVVFEPRTSPIKSGIFKSLHVFTQTPTFSQIIWACLRLALQPASLLDISATRIEAFLPAVLHLMLIAVAEDKVVFPAPQPHRSFCDSAIHTLMPTVDERFTSILTELYGLLGMHDHHESSKPKIRVVIERLRSKRPAAFDQSIMAMKLQVDDQQTESRHLNTARDVVEKKRKAQERQAQMMASFKKQQRDFLANQPANISSDDWSDVGSDTEMDSDFVNKSWPFPRDTCIFCQEDTDDQRLYGTLAYVNKSNIFRCTDLSNHDHVSEVGMTPLTYDRSIDGLRPFGIARRNLRDQKGLGKGWLPSDNSTGPVATSCGHVMHWSCFETFNAATERRQNLQIARNHPERVSVKEFVCPLCKALGNWFLPIVWKQKEVHPPAELHTGSFEQWITAQAPFLVSRVPELSESRREYSQYLSDTLLATYASGLIARSGLTGGQNVQAAEASTPWRMPAFLGGGRPGLPPTLPTDLREVPEPSGRQPHKELLDAYRRLKITIESNHLLRLREKWTNKINSCVEVSSSGLLAFALSSTIAAAEITQRGTAAPTDTSTLLDTVSRQTLTHLRVLSETCSSYTAIYNVQNPAVHSESIALVGSQVVAMFGDRMKSASYDNSDVSKTQLCARRPLLDEDIFDFLTAASVLMAPSLRLEIKHVLRLCFTAEIIKVTTAFLDDYQSVSAFAAQDVNSRTDSKGAEIEQSKQTADADQMQDFSVYVQQIIAQVKHAVASFETESSPDTPFAALDENPNTRYKFDQFLRSAIHSYALPFLRKCLLLLHVRGGIDFAASNDAGPSGSETERLSRLLGVPTIDELIASFNQDTAASRSVCQLTEHWISSWIHSRYQQSSSVSTSGNTEDSTGTVQVPSTMSTIPDSSPTKASQDDKSTPGRIVGISQPILTTRRAIKLPHPGIYELITMPTTHDTLNALTLSHRCPTTGGPMSDPSLCLLCGTLLCGKGACCANSRPTDSGLSTGGCYQHQALCGGTVGMFLNIRQCAILLMNGRHGSWFPAPYLDMHGEVDVGLRRSGRLYLNEYRVEKGLRSVWLEHGIASAVARRLEGDVNNGGWETL